MSRPPWWPYNPYPEDVFTMTTEKYIEAVPDDALRTAISGYVGRKVFEMSSDRILNAAHEAMLDAIEAREASPDSDLSEEELIAMKDTIDFYISSGSDREKRLARMLAKAMAFIQREIAVIEFQEDSFASES